VASLTEFRAFYERYGYYFVLLILEQSGGYECVQENEFESHVWHSNCSSFQGLE